MNSCSDVLEGDLKGFSWFDLTDKRPEAWISVCDAFCVDDDIRQKIEENSDSLIIRCLDVVHYLYHYCSNLSWSSVDKEVRKTDCHLLRT